MRATAEGDSPIVSFDDEPLILVDADDRVVGHRPKAACHDGRGALHRALSVFLFDAAGRVLLQQRSAGKRLWPRFWSNSCCSHPRRGEEVQAAAERRIIEELAVTAPVRFAYKFVYRADYGDAGAEHEMCSVFVGRVAGPVHTNPREVAAIRYLAPAELDDELAERPDAYTPWLHLEWTRLRQQMWPWVEAQLAG